MSIFYLVLILVFLVLWWLNKEMKLAIKNQTKSKQSIIDKVPKAIGQQDDLFQPINQAKKVINKSKAPPGASLVNIVVEQGKIVERSYRGQDGLIYKVRS